MKKVFLDTETSGLAPGEIAQLSMIIEEETGEVRANNYFFKIKSITEDAEKICGRGLDFYETASNGKTFADYKDEIYNEIKDATLIAHNLKFDENFISTEFWRQNIVFTPAGRFCTMDYFKPILKIPGRYGKPKNPKLEELVDYFNINKEKVKRYSEQLFGTSDTGGFHDARYDTTSMYVVFKIYQDSLHNMTSWKETFVNG